LHEIQDVITRLEYLRQVISQGTNHVKIWSLRENAVSQFHSNLWICRLKRSAACNKIQ